MSVNESTQVLIDRNIKCFEATLKVVTLFHAGQKDKGGQPYVLHPIRIMNKLLEKYPGDYELAAIGAGHDLFEDTEVDETHLRSFGVTERVVNGIRILTKIPDEKPEVYLARIMLNWDAVRVKLEDLKHNMDILRIKRELYAGDLTRLNKYRRMHHVLGMVKGEKTHVS